MGALTEASAWVLTALTEQPRHGYAVLRRVSELADGQRVLRITTLYATLDRLERDGLVHVVAEEVVDGRARRTYDITADGRAALAQEADRLAARAAAARAGLGRAASPATGPGQPGWAPA